MVAEILGGREPGVALDAACGTGRQAEILAGHGHRVIGVDSSPEMLAVARRRVPDGEFHLGELDRLPLPDDAVDLIICTLALTHIPHLPPVLAEFARVLRPGGDLVISDIHPEWGAMNGAGIKARGPAGELSLAPQYPHKLGAYLRSALSLGLQVRRCEELGGRRPDEPWPDSPLPEPGTEIGEWQRWPWSLMGYLPVTGRIASGRPTMIVWHFQQPSAA